MNKTDIRICKTQGYFYSLMARKKYNMSIFSDAFMCSDFCKRHFDTFYSPYQTEFPKAIYELCMPEIEKTLVKKMCASENDRCFSESIGFIYRKIYQETSIPSDELAKMIPYDEIMNYFVNDSDWFEEDHKGMEGIFDELMQKHGLKRKRYDADIDTLLSE